MKNVETFYSKQPSIPYHIRTLAMGLMLILCAIFGTVNAQVLLDNGSPTGEYVGAEPIYEVVDDFYVPGWGWNVSGLRVQGFFLSGGEVGDVALSIYAHDASTNGPDLDNLIHHIEPRSTDVFVTRSTYLDQSVLRVEANFNSVFLEGQKYYWIVMDIGRNGGGSKMYIFGHTPVTHQEAHLIAGTDVQSSSTLMGQAVDAAFVLTGTEIQLNDDIVDLLVTDKLKLKQ
ncbi:MAG: hypothetical protein OEZ58_15750 [Gammaproteobacteria bacterium]|nr:hypothetical protein [Gammaproteobacteria bacterium]